MDRKITSLMSNMITLEVDLLKDTTKADKTRILNVLLYDNNEDEALEFRRDLFEALKQEFVDDDPTVEWKI